MVRTGILDISFLKKQSEYRKYYEMLPDFRKEKADSLGTIQGKIQSVGVWILYEAMKKRFSFSDEMVYNLSHSENYALCAVSDCSLPDVKVGCDVEWIGNYQEKIAKRFFCVEEYERLQKLDPKEREKEFYRYWVLKESFMKAVRKGMAQSTMGFLISMDEKGHPFLERQPAAFTQQFFYQEYPITKKDAKAAVCTTDEAVDPVLYDDWQGWMDNGN